MVLSANVIDSFCEIKYAANGVTVCTGNITNVDDGRIYLKNIVTFIQTQNFAGTITVLNRKHGLQVFKADIKQMTAGYVVLENLSRVVNSDRRSGYRASVGLQALVTINSEPNVGNDAIIQDMSVSGISLSVYKALDIGNIIHVQFPLQNGSHVCEADCTVVRNIGSINYSMRRYGCEFTNMSDEDRKLINDYMTDMRIQMMRRIFD